MRGSRSASERWKSSWLWSVTWSLMSRLRSRNRAANRSRARVLSRRMPLVPVQRYSAPVSAAGSVAGPLRFDG